MVRTKEELLQSIRDSLGDRTDDSSLSIIEDVSDTMDSFNDGKHEEYLTRKKYIIRPEQVKTEVKA